MDENLPPAIAQTLRQRGVDATSAHEVGQLRRRDEEQRAIAAREGRTIVTHDRRDFIRISHDAVRQRHPHAGIVLCPPSVQAREIGRIVEALIRLAERYARGLGEYDVVYLA